MINKIETERLIIRNFKVEDGEELHQYLSDPEVVLYEPYNCYTLEEAKKEAALRAANNCFYAVTIKESGKLIGNLFLSKKDFDTWELGYVFNKNFQRMNYAYESVHALLNFAFDNYGVRRVIAMCNPLNDRSWHLLERLGMRREGHFKKNIYFKYDNDGNPIWNDTYIYGILKNEFRS